MRRLSHLQNGYENSLDGEVEISTDTLPLKRYGQLRLQALLKWQQDGRPMPPAKEETAADEVDSNTTKSKREHKRSGFRGASSGAGLAVGAVKRVAVSS
jgi:hypothetical protein